MSVQIQGFNHKFRDSNSNNNSGGFYVLIFSGKVNGCFNLAQLSVDPGRLQREHVELLHTPIGGRRMGIANGSPALVEGLMTAGGTLSRLGPGSVFFAL